MWEKLPITGLTPFTFQDYPDRTACILWFAGCNMACGYCHNPELVKGTLRKVPQERLTKFLESRRGKLEGVVLSGGECTLVQALPELAAYLKTQGFKVKVDTNGTCPQRIESLLAKQLVDFIALDFKAPPEKFEAITGSQRWNMFMKCLRLLSASNIDLEVRTTVHADYLERRDIETIISILVDTGYRGRFVLQKFRPGVTLKNLSAPQQEIDLSGLQAPGLEISYRNFN
jgi:pyruvate formate lyase activating enzyme